MCLLFQFTMEMELRIIFIAILGAASATFTKYGGIGAPYYGGMMGGFGGKLGAGMGFGAPALGAGKMGYATMGMSKAAPMTTSFGKGGFGMDAGFGKKGGFDMSSFGGKFGSGFSGKGGFGMSGFGSKAPMMLSSGFGSKGSFGLGGGLAAKGGFGMPAFGGKGGFGMGTMGGFAAKAAPPMFDAGFGGKPGFGAMPPMDPMAGMGFGYGDMGFGDFGMGGYPGFGYGKYVMKLELYIQ